MGEAIHFRGKDAIVEAYERNNIPACTFCSGKDILFCYDGDSVDEGGQLLGEFIDALKAGKTRATYKLKVYKFPPKDINRSTKENFAFNCTILDDQEDEEVGRGYDTRYLVEEMKQLKATVGNLMIEKEEPEEEEPMPVWQQAINGILSKPEIQNLLMTKVIGFVEGFFNRSPAAAARVAGIPPEVQPGAGSVPDPGLVQQNAGTGADPGALYNALPPEEKAKLDAAMAILLAGDPAIGTNLYKLANILQQNPGKYRMYAALL